MLFRSSGKIKTVPGGSDGKSVCLRCGRPGLDPWVGKIPWRRRWQSTPVLLPGKSHGQRSLVGYSPWGRKELDTTERLHFHFLSTTWGFSGGSDGKESACNVGDLGLIPGSGRSHRDGNLYPLQYSWLENTMDRGDWRSTIPGVVRVGQN